MGGRRGGSTLGKVGRTLREQENFPQQSAPGDRAPARRSTGLPEREGRRAALSAAQGAVPWAAESCPSLVQLHSPQRERIWGAKHLNAL